MKKNYKKLIPLLFMLTMLTGCGSAEYREVAILGIEEPVSMMYGAGAACKFALDKSIAHLMNVLSQSFTFAAIPKYIRSASGYFSNLGTLVGWFQVLSLGYIAIRFGWMIVTEYILTQDNRPAISMMEQFKKLFVALIMTFTLPTIIFSSYAGSTYLALNLVSNTQSETANKYIMQEKMDALGITYASYCKVSVDGEDVKVPTSNASTVNVMYPPGEVSAGATGNAKKVYQAITRSAKDTPYEDSVETTYAEIWNATCGQGDAYRVDQGLLQSEYSSSMITYTKPNGKGGLADSALGTLLVTLVTFVFWGISGYMVVKRTLDVVFLTLMSWYYCGESVTSNPRVGAFGALGKKLLSICLTQFFVIVEMGVYLTLQTHTAGAGGEGLFFLMMQLAWISFMLGTPTFIQDVVNDTGAGSDAMGAVNVGRKLWGNIRARG